MTESWQEVDVAKLHDDYLKVNVELIKSEQKNKNLTAEILALTGLMQEMREHAHGLEVRAGMYKTDIHRLHEALELSESDVKHYSAENDSLRDALNEALGMLRDGLRAYEDEQYASILEGYVNDAVRVLEEIE